MVVEQLHHLLALHGAGHRCRVAPRVHPEALVLDDALEHRAAREVHQAVDLRLAVDQHRGGGVGAAALVQLPGRHRLQRLAHPRDGHERGRDKVRDHRSVVRHHVVALQEVEVVLPKVIPDAHVHRVGRVVAPNRPHDRPARRPGLAEDGLAALAVEGVLDRLPDKLPVPVDDALAEREVEAAAVSGEVQLREHERVRVPRVDRLPNRTVRVVRNRHVSEGRGRVSPAPRRREQLHLRLAILVEEPEAPRDCRLVHLVGVSEAHTIAATCAAEGGHARRFCDVVDARVRREVLVRSAREAQRQLVTKHVEALGEGKAIRDEFEVHVEVPVLLAEQRRLRPHLPQVVRHHIELEGVVRKLAPPPRTPA
mmetsp:Transcript_22468/g.50888  ORF Transcript_22468/g.50888 Transcript_22468/m.50888 type:complete len:367 (-) Transcript_22468:203-1303(-)